MAEASVCHAMSKTIFVYADADSSYKEHDRLVIDWRDDAMRLTAKQADVLINALLEHRDKVRT